MNVTELQKRTEALKAQAERDLAEARRIADDRMDHQAAKIMADEAAASLARAREYARQRP